MFEVPKQAILHCCKWHYINTSMLLRDFSARHCAKEFSNIFSLCKIFTVGACEAYRSQIVCAGSYSS